MALDDDLVIGIPCPGCGEKTAKTIRWLKANDHFICGCAAVVTVDSTKLAAGLEDAKRRIDALTKGFRKR
jgi:hypothetical protein